MERDRIIFDIIEREHQRQKKGIELIASENFVSDEVMKAMGSCLTNKYAEGYPGHRYYGGCQVVDESETIAIERLKQLFGAEWANVQPHSGAQANMAVFMAVMKPGDKFLGLNLSHGGHLSHGSPVNFSGLVYQPLEYNVTPDTNLIDYDMLEEVARREHPRLIVGGASAYSREWDYARIRRIADEVGAIFMFDMAHPAGLIAAGLLDNPVKYAHIVTSTTHKTLRGPRGGVIMMGKDFDDLADIKGDHKDKKAFSDTPVIEASGLGHKGTIKPFDLKINKGEVIGLTGLLGSGRSELVRSIYGADKADSGTLKINGKEAKIGSPLDAMKLGMAYLPEDRKAEGIIADLSVRENIIIALQAKKGMFHPLSRKEMEEAADKYIEMLQIKTASRETPIKSLSGGNQQKVILGRWLLTNPEYLILDEPTRGIDIGTKTEIQKIVLDLADQGMAVTFISSEVEEMLRTCSRMAVLRDGEKVGELEESELSQANIMKAIAGGDEK